MYSNRSEFLKVIFLNVDSFAACRELPPSRQGAKKKGSNYLGLLYCPFAQEKS